MTIAAGTRLGRYEIRSQIGAGGMGEVYLAQDTQLRRPVALKLLPADVSQNRDRLRRFGQEAYAVAALNHQSIAHIYEIGEANKLHFIAMEYVDGETLREKIYHDHAPLLQLLIYLTQVAEGLTKAHAAGIVHCDLKPDNIMVNRDDHAKILDFGLAKLVELQRSFGADGKGSSEVATAILPQQHSIPGMVMGTIGYMSPEQAQGKVNEIDHRSDIFSFGCILYEAATGQKAFEGKDVLDSLHKIVYAPTPQIKDVNSLAPDELQRIVRRCLAKEPEKRYQSIKEVKIELEELQQQLKSIDEKEYSTRLVTRSVAPSSSSEQSDVNEGSTLILPTGEMLSRPTAPTTTLDAPRPPRGSRLLNTTMRRHPAGSAAAVILVAAIAGIAYFYHATKSIIPITSVAVLPFINVNSDPDTEYISDGMTDNIIERLSQLPDLKVMSHSAVFHYKGRETDPRAIRRELGVEAVLTGRVVKRSDALTIYLELVDARDDSHIWGEQYDRRLTDVLAVQREIPVDIADKLRLRLSGASRERLTRAYTGNAEAYQLYLKGRYSWEKWTQEGTKQAVEYFEEAIKKDPNYALAYSGLADTYTFGAYAGAGLPQKEAHRRAREAATKALSLDPQLGEAHAALAEVLLYDDWDFVGTEKEFKRALELNPSYAEGHHEYSHLLLLLGRIDESLAESTKFLELDPVSEPPIGHLGYNYLYARQYDEAIKQFQRDLQLYPDSPQHSSLGEAYFQKGMFSEAVEEYLKGFSRSGYTPDKIAGLRAAFTKAGIKGFYQKLIEQLKAGPQTEWDHVGIGELYARLGERDQAFEWLEKAYAEHSDGLARLKEELGFDNLRSDPRFADLVRRVGLPQ